VRYLPRSLRTLLTALLAVCLFAASGDARAQGWQDQGGGSAPANQTPPELKGVDIVEHLNGQLPLDAVFRDQDGKTVKLGDYFDGKRPVVFVFAYHTCPMLCSLVLDATVKSLNNVQWTVGDEFDVVSLSFDPKDTPQTATKKLKEVVGNYTRAKGSTRGWHFLTGEADQIRRVTDAFGFDYRYDPRQKQFAHPAAIYLLKPDGRIARYLYGIQYNPSDIRLGLLEASEGKSISTTERILLYCYHYDPQGKHYSLVAMNVMRLGGAITLVLLGGLLLVMWARERRKRRKTRLATAANPEHAGATSS